MHSLGLLILVLKPTKQKNLIKFINILYMYADRNRKVLLENLSY